MALLEHPWIIADMDSTLLRKSPGEWPDLEETGREEDSPVRLPLFTWLRSGGSLLVVTSDDGHRPWRQLMRQIPAELRGSVVLSTADGAVLSSLQDGEYTEEEIYWGKALQYEGVGSTGLPASDLTTEIACQMKRDFLADCMSDSALLATVSPDWRQDGYANIIAQYDSPEALKEGLTTELMLGMNALMPRKFASALPLLVIYGSMVDGLLAILGGSLVWRNSAGNPDFWEIDDDDEWRKLRNEKIEQEKLEPPSEQPRWTNCFVLGMNSAISQQYIDRYLPLRSLPSKSLNVCVFF